MQLIILYCHSLYYTTTIHHTSRCGRRQGTLCILNTNTAGEASFTRRTIRTEHTAPWWAARVGCSGHSSHRTAHSTAHPTARSALWKQQRMTRTGMAYHLYYYSILPPLTLHTNQAYIVLVCLYVCVSVCLCVCVSVSLRVCVSLFSLRSFGRRACSRASKGSGPPCRTRYYYSPVGERIF